MTDIKIFGCDGSRWDLRRGPVRLIGDFEGLGMPTFDKYTQQSTGVDGQRQTGVRAQPRPAYMDVGVGTIPGGSPFLDVHKAWWQAFDTNRVTTITVSDAKGDSRYLDVMFDDDGGHAHSQDPARNEYYVVGMNFTANDPWWYGDTIVHEFEPNEQRVSFFPGPPFRMNSGTFTGTAVLPNPGELEAWPVWQVDGPVTGFSITTAGQTLSGSFDIPEGVSLFIDTRPNQKRAWLYDGNIQTPATRLLDSWGFASIPAGFDVTVDVLVFGDGRASVSFVPRYRMAF